MTPQRIRAVMLAGGLAVGVITTSEGLKLSGYYDPAPGRYETICWGHMQPGVVGKTYTEQKCAAILVDDITKHGLEIDRCITRDIPLEVRAAFTSFAFNVGSDAACKSTMFRKANAGDFRGACAELDRWVFSGGKKLNGLVKRRQAERALCESAFQGLRS